MSVFKTLVKMEEFAMIEKEATHATAPVDGLGGIVQVMNIVG